MKRFLTVAIVGCLSLGFFACTKKDEAAPNTTPDQAVQAPNPEGGAPAAAPAPGSETAPAPAEGAPGS